MNIRKANAEIFWIGDCDGCDDAKYLVSVTASKALQTAAIVFVYQKLLHPFTYTKHCKCTKSSVWFFGRQTDNWYTKPIVINTKVCNIT